LTDQERRLLKGMMNAFADPLRCLELSKRLAVEDPPFQLDWERLTARELLESIAAIVTHMGPQKDMRYDALYVLVDCVDETRVGADAAAALLEPLIRERSLLEMPNLAFKFFLPIEVGHQVQERVPLRPDRLFIHTITWNREDLINVIQQRFTCYNHDPSKRLEDICTASAKHTIMDRLIEESGGSPRTLLRLCNALFQYHVRRTDRSLIDSIDISNTIADFNHRLQVEASAVAPQSYPEIATPSNVSASVPETGVHVDTSGHVWLNGEQLDPPLSPQEFRLLETLYKVAPEIVPHEDLILNVWPTARWMSDNDETKAQDAQNLRKLISRLRERLDCEREGQAQRFVKNVRGRGYWLDVRGETT
jgi:DNA-binding winged helix-turn-helix (wHTH) protein